METLSNCPRNKLKPQKAQGAQRKPRRLSQSFISASNSFSVNHAAGDGRIAVDAAVAQKGPVAANIFQVMQVDFAEQNFFFVVRSLRRARGQRDRRKTTLPRIPGLCPARNCRECRRSQSRRDSPRRHKRHWRSRARAGSSARHRVAPRQIRPSPPDAIQLPSDKTECSRPATPSAARLRDTTDPSRQACQVFRRQCRKP